MTGAPDLVARAGAMAATPGRRVLGITGAPGAGKSTLATTLADAVGAGVVVVPMDGFHLAQRELERLGRVGRKGAPDTFDGVGFVALLRRIRRCEEATVYAPTFDRDLEEPIAGAIAVPAEAPLVITEGNYLGLGEEPWAQVRALLDELWFVAVDDSVRIERLVARHVAHGKLPSAARAWATGPDQANTELINSTRGHADRVVRL